MSQIHISAEIVNALTNVIARQNWRLYPGTVVSVVIAGAETYASAWTGMDPDLDWVEFPYAYHESSSVGDLDPFNPEVCGTNRDCGFSSPARVTAQRIVNAVREFWFVSDDRIRDAMRNDIDRCLVAIDTLGLH